MDTWMIRPKAKYINFIKDKPKHDHALLIKRGTIIEQLTGRSFLLSLNRTDYI